MASVVDNHDFLLPDLATPMPLAASESSDSVPTPYDDGQISTPTSSAIGTPRETENKNKRRSVARTGKSKSRRVRTGCLTCRERHLKCDEALGRCQNCRKSDRVCRRGIRLNFIDTQTVAPPHHVTRASGAQLTFRDESRHIASEYVGGFERYPSPEPDLPLENELPSQFELSDVLSPSLQPRSDVSTACARAPQFGAPQTETINMLADDGSQPTFYPVPPGQPHATFAPSKHIVASCNVRRCFTAPDELSLVRVFVEEIGPWMDTMDTTKHFSKILPFSAINEPMLSNAFMACAARHIQPLDPMCGEDKATYLYDTVSQELLALLQDPERDSALCVTTAILLGVYEMMCSRDLHGMYHVSDARTVIKQCHWDARTPGLGGAAFWLDVSMELLTCIQSNWTMSWDPDTWGVDLNLDDAQSNLAGDEELWTCRMVYICAKVSNFRAFTSQFPILDHEGSELEIKQRRDQWALYRRWCYKWAENVPRSMKPLGLFHSFHNGLLSSAFPEVWLMGQSAILARLFYHTAEILIWKTHPMDSSCAPAINVDLQQHAHSICGIVAQVKFSAIVGLLIRFLAFAAKCLTEKNAQEQALGILDDLVNESGWHTECVRDELLDAWGWTNHQQIPTPADAHTTSMMNIIQL